MRFLNFVMNNFENKEYDPMILNFLFNDFESKPIALIEIPFCNEIEKVSKQLLKKIKLFTKEKYDLRIVWKTKKVRQLFPLKEKNPFFSCKIYERVCSCKEKYTGETKRIVEISIKMQIKIQNKPNISFNTLIMFSNGTF